MHENSQTFAHISKLVKMAKIQKITHIHHQVALLQKKCLWPYNSQTVHRTFKNIIYYIHIFSRSLDPAESPDIGHAHFRLDFYACKNMIQRKHTFLKSSQTVRPIFTKFGRQHLQTDLTKNYPKNFYRLKIAHITHKQICVAKYENTICHISAKINAINAKRKSHVCHDPLEVPYTFYENWPLGDATST